MTEYPTVQTKDIVVEDGGGLELAKSPSMEPYIANLEARISGRGQEGARNAIAELALEQRYIWRIASSLKQAFADFDQSSVRADLSTMKAGDFDTVVGLIERRPVQFAILLRTIIGSEEMERMLLEAIDIAKYHNLEIRSA